MAKRIPSGSSEAMHEMVARTRYEHEADQEFCRRASAWYEENRSRLVLDQSALYPAPPFNALFTTEAP
jgi:hypothetical protein